ncbi:MAG TPA: class I SAM-dependent methyltransferase [Actinocrinis sp.]|uniref:class I SAM-dependent methyltransferase n=1 Tax=Actinocrinis sp. TaxID=1920516 RepID=UPI002DDCE0CF|nr:class I SAM-dependent methyltransferase [Actinocrinis sp.]HEV2342570.1 class I SAM-dependent methyltransferase [Actinocrinis sp.]
MTSTDTPSAELPDHVRANREYWDAMAENWVAPGERSWASDRPAWGVFQRPQSEVPFLPGDIDGLDAIELGCGTGYVSAWMARRGARPVGIDNSAAQLRTARRLQTEYGLEFPLLHGNAERVPYPDASFDLAVSEYGAAIWCDPYAWIPEAARLLRPGGRLVFLCNSVVSMLCAPYDADEPSTERMLRPQRDMHRFAWPEGGVEFHLGHGDMIRLLRGSGFEIEGLIEIFAPEDATDSGFAYAPAGWSRQWPVEEVWQARRV